jgi:hypothetical protein
VNRRDLYIFLGLEFFAVVWAGAVFSLVSTRLLAAALQDNRREQVVCAAQGPFAAHLSLMPGHTRNGNASLRD